MTGKRRSGASTPKSEAARKGAITRRLRKAAGTDANAVLLLELREVQRFSDRAKDRPAHGKRYREYRTETPSKYAYHAYQNSRTAGRNDYSKKGGALERAAAAAMICGTVAGWRSNTGGDPRLPYLVYFDLATGQVSFHSETDCGLPPYEGEWDGVRNASRERIEAAIDAYLDGPVEG